MDTAWIFCLLALGHLVSCEESEEVAAQEGQDTDKGSIEVAPRESDVFSDNEAVEPEVHEKDRQTLESQLPSARSLTTSQVLEESTEGQGKQNLKDDSVELPTPQPIFSSTEPTIEAPLPQEAPGPDISIPQPSAEKLFGQAGWVLEGAARGVAELVSSSYKSKQSNEQPQLLAGFLRLLGLEPTKLRAIALNALIFIAEVIGKSLGEGPTSEKAPEGNPILWVLDNIPPKVSELMTKAEDRGLGERVIDGLGVENDCVQLLVCKVTPVVWGMQASLRRPPPPGLSHIERMFAHLPSLGQLHDHAASCEMRFPSCRLRHSLE